MVENFLCGIAVYNHTAIGAYMYFGELWSRQLLLWCPPSQFQGHPPSPFRSQLFEPWENNLAREPTVCCFRSQLLETSADWQISWPVTTALVSTELVSKPSNQPVLKSDWPVLKPARLTGRDYAGWSHDVITWMLAGHSPLYNGGKLMTSYVIPAGGVTWARILAAW